MDYKVSSKGLGKWNASALWLSVAIAVSIGSTGCGGGGGSDDPVSTGVTGVGLSGIAAKGIIKNGVVTAHELDASKQVIATVGSTTTNDNGRYSLTLTNDYNGGPVQITVSLVANSEMKCDVPVGCGVISGTTTPITFGDFYKPAAFEMMALLPGSVANSVVSANITPFTHMAVERAKAAAEFNTAAIANANSEVSVLLGGLDILNTAPVDITNPVAVSSASPTQRTYAALASAVANQGATDADGQPKLAETIALLATSFAAGTMLADDSTGDDSAQISLQEIVTAANATFIAANVSDTTGVVAALEAAVANGGTIDPEPAPSASEPALVRAKAMIAEVRTWGQVINTEVGTKGTEFEAQIDMASNALDALSSNQGPGEALGEAMTVVGQYLDAASPGSNLADYVTDLFPVLPLDGSPFESGTITSSGNTITISNGIIFGFTLNMTATIPTDMTQSSTFTVGIISATVVKAGVTSLTVNNGLVTMSLASPYTVDYSQINLGTEAALPAITDIAFDLDVMLEQSTGKDASGNAVALDSPVRFSGGLMFDIDPVAIQNSVAVNQGALPKAFELKGAISNATNSTDVTLVMNVTNTDTFTFEGEFGVVGTTQYSDVPGRGDMVSWSYTGNTFNYTSPDVSIQYDYISTTEVLVSENSYGYMSSYPVVTNAANIVEFVAERVSAYSWPFFPSVYVWVDREGSYVADLTAANYSVNGAVDGTLVESEYNIGESVSNYIDADMGITFTTQLTGLPLATVNITADRTAYEVANVATTISYGTKQLHVSADVTNNFVTDIASIAGTLTISNQDNIVLSITDANVDDLTPFTGTISFNGTQLGTVTESGNFIKFSYVDGTFELF